jgi:hypothetical protein
MKAINYILGDWFGAIGWGSLGSEPKSVVLLSGGDGVGGVELKRSVLF